MNELKKTIGKLKVSSSPGTDNIHNHYLKNLPYSYQKILLALVNSSIKFGLPPFLKTANITMIPKKGIKSFNPNDYRPISLTNNVGKLIERLVKNKIYKYLEL